MMIVSDNLLNLADQQKIKARKAFDDGRDGDGLYHIKQAIKYINAAHAEDNQEAVHVDTARAR